MCISSKYAVLRTKYKIINRIRKKTGFKIYSCYSNEFDKNMLISRAFKKISFEVDRFLIGRPNKGLIKE